MADVILKENVFERFRAMKAQIVDVEDGLDALRDININSGVVNKDSGIDEVRLSLSLAAAQTRQDAVGLNEADASLRQSDALPIPE